MSQAEPAPKPAPTRLRKLTLLLLALFGLAYALFAQDNVSHNTLCRAAMTAHMVQYGRVDINGFEEFTTDKAFRDGDYFCDKAPGMSFLAAPAALVFTQFFPVTPETPYNRIWTSFLYLCALTTSALLSAAAALLLFHYIARRTQNLDAALVAALAFGLGGPVWGWATSFFSHAAAASLLLMGFIALDVAARRQKASVRNDGVALLAGLGFGAAVAVEYTLLVPALIIGAAFAITGDWRKPVALLRMFALAATGAIAALIPVLWFHAAAFGSPLQTGYAFTVEYAAHRSGLFGIGAPNLDIIGKLLLSPERGVIWYAPIVLAMAWACVRLARRADLRLPAMVAGLIALWYLCMNSGFEYWHGGASTGPRYLTPAIAFAALPLGLAWPHFATWERRGALALLGLSVFINFACVAVGMTAGDLFTRILPSFFAADLAATLTHFVFEQPSLVHFAAPLLAFGVLGWLIWKERRRLNSAS